MSHSNLTSRIATTTLSSFLIAGLASSSSWAHPGHGSDGGDWSVLHYLPEPDHLVVALGLAVLVAWPFVRGAIRARSAAHAR